MIDQLRQVVLQYWASVGEFLAGLGFGAHGSSLMSAFLLALIAALVVTPWRQRARVRASRADAIMGQLNAQWGRHFGGSERPPSPDVSVLLELQREYRASSFTPVSRLVALVPYVLIAISASGSRAEVQEAWRSGTRFDSTGWLSADAEIDAFLSACLVALLLAFGAIIGRYRTFAVVLAAILGFFAALSVSMIYSDHLVDVMLIYFAIATLITRVLLKIGPTSPGHIELPSDMFRRAFGVTTEVNGPTRLVETKVDHLAETMPQVRGPEPEPDPDSIIRDLDERSMVRVLGETDGVGPIQPAPSDDSRDVWTPPSEWWHVRSLRRMDPRKISGYRVLGVFGQGSSGLVYHVRRRNHHYALKLITAPMDSVGKQRFVREMNSMRAIRDPRVAYLEDFGQYDGQPFFVMPAVRGTSLAQIAAANRRLSPESVLELANGLAGALEKLHAAEVLHRDVKPDNVVLASGGPVLVDLGIAQVVGQTQLTEHGYVNGTPGFTPPERLAGGGATPAADTWGWAKTIELALTLVDQSDENRQGPGLDRIREAFRICLADDPERRFPNGAALLASLRTA